MPWRARRGGWPDRPPSTPWSRSFEALRFSGWDSYLLATVGYGVIERGLRRHGGPATSEQILAPMEGWKTFRLSDPALAPSGPFPADSSFAEAERGHADRLDRLAAAASMPRVTTIGELITALYRVGVLATTHTAAGVAYLPNPAALSCLDDLDGAFVEWLPMRRGSAGRVGEGDGPGVPVGQAVPVDGVDPVRCRRRRRRRREHPRRRPPTQCPPGSESCRAESSSATAARGPRLTRPLTGRAA